MTIQQHISDRWPETEGYLRSRPAVAYDDTRDRAIASVIALLWSQVAPGVVPPTVEVLNAGDALVQEQIADLVVKRLIPLAKTTIAQNETLSHSESVQPGGSGSTSYYNRVDVLDELATALDEALAARSKHVVTVIKAQQPATAMAPRRAIFFTTARGGRGR